MIGLPHVARFVRQRPLVAKYALRCLPDWHIYVNVPQLGKMRIRLRRNRSYWLRNAFTHEWYPLSILKSLVRSSDTVWDVGANIGLYSRVLVQWFHAERVIAFEPMSENLPELRFNLELGKITDRVQVVPWALGNIDAEVDFQVDDMQGTSGTLDCIRNGAACMGRAALALPPKTERVSCRTVDSIIDARELPTPDVIKADVEGAEMLLLSGGRRFLNGQGARLLIETHGVDESGMEVIRSSLRFLFDAGYAVAACVPDSWCPTRHMRLEPSMIAQVRDQSDVLFIAASKNPEDLPHAVESDVSKLFLD
jgi:FkbM family methyltransferase